MTGCPHRGLHSNKSHPSTEPRFWRTCSVSPTEKRGRLYHAVEPYLDPWPLSLSRLKDVRYRFRKSPWRLPAAAKISPPTPSWEPECYKFCRMTLRSPRGYF